MGVSEGLPQQLGKSWSEDGWRGEDTKRYLHPQSLDLRAWNLYLLLYLLGAWWRDGRRRKRESQADSRLSAEPSVALNLRTMKPRPEPKLRARALTD